MSMRSVEVSPEVAVLLGLAALGIADKVAPADLRAFLGWLGSEDGHRQVTRSAAHLTPLRVCL